MPGNLEASPSYRTYVRCVKAKSFTGNDVTQWWTGGYGHGRD